MVTYRPAGRYNSLEMFGVKAALTGERFLDSMKNPRLPRIFFKNAINRMAEFVMRMNRPDRDVK